ncbi:hypothetical protein F5884DRAFT_250899 [Xylogone sp. PMI_703]|nr:hypothetical protein F5884DRAFT_250899 [Xylogone sp. PMI_703]
MPQYKFVAVEGGDGKSTNLTGSIRSHAIRTGLRNTTYSSRVQATLHPLYATEIREELGFHFKLPRRTETSRDWSRPNNESPKLTTMEYRNVKYRIEPICSGSIDPFNTLPVPTNLEVDHLVRYFLIKFDLNWATVNRKKLWFPYALQSAPMMHSTLAMAAVLWRVEHPALQYSIQLEGIHQKGEAMREIGARLASRDFVRHDDQINFTMSTIATLVIVEVCDSDFEAAEIHLRGLRELFSSGGYDYNILKDEFILCKSINLADIQVATALGRPLMFPLLHTAQVYLPTQIVEHALYLPLDHSMIKNISYSHFGIFSQLRQLLLARQSSMVSQETLQILLNAVDESILIHLYQDRVDIFGVTRCSCALILAAHVFMYVTLRQVPHRSPLVRRMCNRLQSLVGLTSPAEMTWTENSAALLWIAFVGLLGTGERVESCPEGQWFLNLFESTVQGYPQGLLQNNGSIRKILSTFLWDESYCQPVLEKYLGTYVL